MSSEMIMCFSINMKYYVDWFLFMKPTLHSRVKSLLIKVHNSILCLWIWFISVLLKISVYIHKGYWYVDFVFCFCNVLFSWKYWLPRVSRKYPIFIHFLEEFIKNWSLLFNCLVNVTSEAVWALDFYEVNFFWLFIHSHCFT